AGWQDDRSGGGGEGGGEGALGQSVRVRVGGRHRADHGAGGGGEFQPGLFPSARGGRCVLPIGDRAVRGGALRAARGGGAVRPAGGGGGGGCEARARGSRLVERAGRVELGERGVVRVAEATGRRGTAAPAVATSELGGDRQGRATADVSEPGRVR